MNCGYCGARKNDTQERCGRCGRKPEDTGEFTVPRLTGALAPKLEPSTHAEPVAAAGPVLHVANPGRPATQRPVQVPLFFEKPAHKVIPFEAFAPPAAQPQPKAPTQSRPPAKRSARNQSSPANRAASTQTSLPFLPPALPKPRTLRTQVDAVIYCEEPVAPPLHRLVAGALDWSMVLIGYGAFLILFRICCGEIVFNKTNAAIFVAMLPLTGLAYGLVWTIAGTETAGMRWTHLRVTTFEGFSPDWKQRLARLAGSCLSFCTILGLLWIFADEEGLTWQDHISRTFPTPKRWSSRVIARQ
jgi:uncharacterized RDD family membrane protein YckC